MTHVTKGLTDLDSRDLLEALAIEQKVVAGETQSQEFKDFTVGP